MRVSLDKNIVELLRRRQEAESDKTIEEIAHEILKEQIAIFNADPENYELEAA